MCLRSASCICNVLSNFYTIKRQIFFFINALHFLLSMLHVVYNCVSSYTGVLGLWVYFSTSQFYYKESSQINSLFFWKYFCKFIYKKLLISSTSLFICFITKMKCNILRFCITGLGFWPFFMRRCWCKEKSSYLNHICVVNPKEYRLVENKDFPDFFPTLKKKKSVTSWSESYAR